MNTAASAFHRVSTGCDTVDAGGSKSSRALDLSLALIWLVILAPLMLMVMALIRMESKGPSLFRQKRCGEGGRPFYIYKFRTMYVAEDGDEVRQAQRQDPRITRVGRILRRTSIDEIPQLLNVLLGDMSIVGPRPHAIAHDEYYAARIPEYVQRYRVKPGMTGWAQIKGCRGETPEIEHMVRRVHHDIWYVENRSARLNLIIILRTPIALFNDAF